MFICIQVVLYSIIVCIQVVLYSMIVCIQVVLYSLIFIGILVFYLIKQAKIQYDPIECYFLQFTIWTKYLTIKGTFLPHETMWRQSSIAFMHTQVLAAPALAPAVGCLLAGASFSSFASMTPSGLPLARSNRTRGTETVACRLAIKNHIDSSIEHIAECQYVPTGGTRQQATPHPSTLPLCTGSW